MSNKKCILCNRSLKNFKERPEGHDGYGYDCPNCGKFLLSGRAFATLNGVPAWKKAALSFQVWRMQGPGHPPEIHDGHLDAIRHEDLPEPDEQLNNLIAYWGKQQGIDISKKLDFRASELAAKIGAISEEAVRYIVREAQGRGLIEGGTMNHEVSGWLTFEGWKEYRRIEKGKGVSHHAFMAMPFGQQDVTRIVDDFFRPAVAETGFPLKRLDDEPTAGLIDNRMRVEIRQCKFLIADLTHDNNGAYWEAGYAEGLDKPVIYTCERSHFEQKRTHFDTNHCQTVVWDLSSAERAAEDLKATIRNTFPFEAKMPMGPSE